MINVNDLKNGTVIEYDGQLMMIIEFCHVLQNKVAYTRVKMKNVRTGSITETALKGADTKFKLCEIERKQMQFIYSTGDNYAFMDNETYEQVEIPAARLEWEKNFLAEGMICEVQFYGQEILTVILPDKITVKVAKCDPAVRGDTKTSATKDAFLESGFLVKVPMFINEGEEIIISTSDGSYFSRG